VVAHDDVADVTSFRRCRLTVTRRHGGWLVADDDELGS